MTNQGSRRWAVHLVITLGILKSGVWIFWFRKKKPLFPYFREHFFFLLFVTQLKRRLNHSDSPLQGNLWQFSCWLNLYLSAVSLAGKKNILSLKMDFFKCTILQTKQADIINVSSISGTFLIKQSISKPYFCTFSLSVARACRNNISGSV